MPERLSELFGVPQGRWDDTGAFDSFIGVDARLHIDPHLLASSSVQEFRNARAAFDQHFVGVMKLLQLAESEGDDFYKRANRLLTFREIPNTGLGYSREGKGGSGIGKQLAAGLASLGKKIVDAGIVDPDIFSLMGLLSDGIGADRISDMTAAIVVEPLLAFTDRIVRELNLPARTIERGDRRFVIPVVPRTGEVVLLVPRDVLRHLPVAESWSEIDTIAVNNDALRERVNRMIGETWKQAIRVPKKRLREAILGNPELLRDLLSQYKAKPATPYNLAADPEMLHLWQPLARGAAASMPLRLRLSAEPSLAEMVGVVRALLERFKELMEANRLYRLVYNDDGTPRREKAAQLALFGVADAYCAANDIDLSPETDSGSGPVDFKFSHGYSGRILAEVKLSTNSKLGAGFEAQVAAYEAAESSYHSFYVVLRVDDSEAKIRRLIMVYNQATEKAQRCPELVIIDARPQASASKR